MTAPFSSPEAELAALRAENARLRRLLDLTPEQARPSAAAQTGLFLDRPGPVTAWLATASRERRTGWRLISAPRAQ